MLTAHVHHRAALIHSCQEQASVDHSSGHLNKDWHMTRQRADKMVVQDVTWLAQPLINILKRQTWLLSDRPRSTIIAAILDDAQLWTHYTDQSTVVVCLLIVYWALIGQLKGSPVCLVTAQQKREKEMLGDRSPEGRLIFCKVLVYGAVNIRQSGEWQREDSVWVRVVR